MQNPNHHVQGHGIGSYFLRQRVSNASLQAGGWVIDLFTQSLYKLYCILASLLFYIFHKLHTFDWYIHAENERRGLSENEIWGVASHAQSLGPWVILVPSSLGLSVFFGPFVRPLVWRCYRLNVQCHMSLNMWSNGTVYQMLQIDIWLIQCENQWTCKNQQSSHS